MPKTRTKEQSLLERGINFFNKNIFNLNYFSATIKKLDQGQIKTFQLTAHDLKKRNTIPLKERIANIISTLYPQDNTLSGGKYYTASNKNNQHAIINKVAKHPAILISSFFGMPNDLEGEWDRFKDISSTNALPATAIAMLLIKNFFGWNGYNHSPQKIVWNIAKLPLVIPYHLLRMITKTLANTLSLITEFLPAFLSQLTLHIALQFNPLHEQEKKALQSLRNSLISGFFFFLSLGFKAAFLTGRTFSSPLQSIRAAWEAGDDFGGKLGVALSLTLATLSMAMTSAAYIALFPFALKIIITKAPLPIANFVANTAFTLFMKVLSVPVVPLLIDKVGFLAFSFASLVIGVVSTVVTSTFAIELVQDMRLDVKRGIQHKPKAPNFTFDERYEPRLPPAPSNSLTGLFAKPVESPAPDDEHPALQL